MEPRPPRATSARIMAVMRSIRSRSRAALWIMTNFQSLRHKVTAQDGDHGKFALLSVHNGARDFHDHGHGWPRWPRVAAVPYLCFDFSRVIYSRAKKVRKGEGMRY